MVPQPAATRGMARPGINAARTRLSTLSSSGRMAFPIECIWRERAPYVHLLRRHHRPVPGLRQVELGALSRAQPA
jgi:hypothetical protein